MVELMALFVTLGAVLYHTFAISMETIIFVGCALALFFSLLTKSLKGMIFGCALGAAVVLGALNLWRVDTPILPELFGNRAFESEVLSVDRRLDRTLFVVSEDGQKIQVTTLGTNDILPGDVVTVRGQVREPQDFVTDSGKLFGYHAYLRSKGISGVVSNATVVLVKKGDVSLKRMTTSIRYGVAGIFAHFVSFPFDGVLGGMVVGYQGALPSFIQDLFRNTGVLHVLVLSGYNITLLAGFLGLILKGLPFRARSMLTIVAIVMLVLISGAGVASIRAGIMGSIAIIAGLAIRTYQPLRALSLAYLCFFFITPMAVFVDPGFHLSFLATLFMVVVLPKVETLFLFIPKTNHVDVRELVVLALTVPIFMLPYMMYFSGTFPLASPLANMLFALVTPLIMVFGILLIILSWLGPVASVLGAIVSVLGTLLLKVLQVFDHLPIWNTPALSWWGVCSIYGLGLFVLFRKEISDYLWQYYRTLRR